MMNFWWQLLPWWAAPLLALGLGLVVLAPLGRQVLQRGVVFIDLAVAQAAAAAALWWSSTMDHPGPWSTRAAACAGALLAAWWVRHLAQRHAAQREALIGLVYVLSAALAVLGASQDPHGREHLSALLAADVLWADWPQVGLMAALAACGWAWSRVMSGAMRSQGLRDLLFYGWFAVVASMAVGVLGLWLVFAGLIVPALLRAAGWSGWACAAGLMAASAAGLGVSSALDWPSGACVIVALSVLGLWARR
jgi:zinc/manganese transport system permease protein